MSDQRLTKKQHYVPRMYLKRWQRENDKRLLVVTKKTQPNSIQIVSVDDELFYQDYCYDIPNLDESFGTSNEAEKALGKLEFKPNRVFQLSSEKAQEINSLYWKQEDTYTIIGNRESDLIDS